MRIVIDILDEVYKQCKMNIDSENIDAVNPRFATDTSIKLLECLEVAVANGTPLPKGHGRLIDESQITACEWDGEHMYCNAPTIIGADNGSEE